MDQSPEALVKDFAAQSYDVVIDYLWGEPVSSIAPEAIFKAFPDIMQRAADGRLVIDLVEMPLREVAAAWNSETAKGGRIVLRP